MTRILAGDTDLTVVSFLTFLPPGRKTSPVTPILAFFLCNRLSWFLRNLSSCSASLMMAGEFDGCQPVAQTDLGRPRRRVNPLLPDRGIMHRITVEGKVLWLFLFVGIARESLSHVSLDDALISHNLGSPDSIDLRDKPSAQVFQHRCRADQCSFGRKLTRRRIRRTLGGPELAAATAAARAAA